MSASSYDGDTESFQSPHCHSRRSKPPIQITTRTTSKRAMSQHPRHRRHHHSRAMSGTEDSGASSANRSGGVTSGSGSSNDRHHRPQDHSHGHDRSQGHVRGKGHSQFYRYSAPPPPPGCRGPPTFLNYPAPHSHHMGHDHHTYSQGYAFGHPSYPETQWPGLGSRIDRTIVIIGDDRREMEYTCRTDMLRNYLPNSRAMELERQWRALDSIIPSGQVDRMFTLAGLNALFRAMQEADRTNHLDIFAAARYNLGHRPYQAATVEQLASTIRGLCHALSWDEGLGCNDGILDQIEAFVLEIIEPVRRLHRPEAVALLVLNLGYVWRPDDRHRAALRAMWDNLDGFERGELKELLKAYIVLRRRGMSFSRMFSEIEEF
ncbi:hypothetical protein MKZ38_007722 [Zalerion maritima]|uniref:Uncharacterized protein n=1 Tax=Zalerion maritima TaxID=339359 RepID=A0AAD5RHF2_9PEZI|nr:hypothetical protein MKZ38_007722 [Zalerion maritima]